MTGSLYLALKTTFTGVHEMPVKIHGKEYKTVAERINEFRSIHPDWSVQTDLVSDDGVLVVMKSTISDHERILSTGYAEEIRGSSMINKTSALENAETSAVGRALAFFGLGGTEIASADEVASAIQAQTNMNGTRVDTKKLDALVDLAIEIVDDPDNDVDNGAPKAREIYEPLSNDERIYVNGQLAAKKFKNESTGREVQYWSAFKKYLQAAGEKNG
jgi:hypothetical protein